MFYPVKIKDRKGKVKKVLPSKKLSKDYWENYFGGLKKRVPLHLKKRGRKSQDLTSLPDEDGNRSSGNDEYSLD